MITLAARQFTRHETLTNPQYLVIILIDVLQKCQKGLTTQKGIVGHYNCLGFVQKPLQHPFAISLSFLFAFNNLCVFYEFEIRHLIFIITSYSMSMEYLSRKVMCKGYFCVWDSQF